VDSQKIKDRIIKHRA